MTLTKKERRLLRTGIHNALCTPRAPASNGRFRFVREERPKFGSADCLCHTLPLKYNGETV